MKSSDIIKDIRSRLNLSQTELADKLGVSFATVNRWEKGHRTPSQIALGNIKRLCADNKIDYTQFEGNSIISSDEVVTLYHGSKSGIVGDIAPSSREHCDFGKGFYMGTEKAQPLTLICNYPDAKLYTVNVDLSGLKILDIEVGIDWALLVAYNRGKMDSVKGTAIYNRIAEMADGCDMLIGFIANDRMLWCLTVSLRVRLLMRHSSIVFRLLNLVTICSTYRKGLQAIMIVEEKALTDVTVRH